MKGFDVSTSSGVTLAHVARYAVSEIGLGRFSDSRYSRSPRQSLTSRMHCSNHKPPPFTCCTIATSDKDDVRRTGVIDNVAHCSNCGIATCVIYPA